MNADDGDSVGYLMLRWEGSWCRGAAIAAIMTVAEMGRAVVRHVDVTIAVA